MCSYWVYFSSSDIIPAAEYSESVLINAHLGLSEIVWLCRWGGRAIAKESLVGITTGLMSSNIDL